MTIPDLAHEMEVKRPSVSRAMQGLKREGLVIRSLNVFSWSLTDVGRITAERVEKEGLLQLRRSMNKLARAILNEKLYFSDDSQKQDRLENWARRMLNIFGTSAERN